MLVLSRSYDLYTVQCRVCHSTYQSTSTCVRYMYNYIASSHHIDPGGRSSRLRPSPAQQMQILSNLRLEGSGACGCVVGENSTSALPNPARS